jgi:hypothetical protein
MVLEHQAAHATRLRKLREIDCVDLTRDAVRTGMRVDIDNAVKTLAAGENRRD